MKKICTHALFMLFRKFTHEPKCEESLLHAQAGDDEGNAKTDIERDKIRIHDTKYVTQLGE